MWEYRAQLVDVIDGDTVRLHADVGFDFGCHRLDLRLLDVWAPELRDPGGVPTQSYVYEWFNGRNVTLRWPVLIRTQKTQVTEPTEKRTFTRYIGDIYDITNGDHLNAQLRHWLSEQTWTA